MAGIISPSMPVFIVRNETFGNVAYATRNEGLGRVLRYDAYGPDVYERLRWMEEILHPTLKAAIESIEGGVLPPPVLGGIKGGVLPPQDWGGARGGIDLWALISQELYMGDECHNRLTVMARNGTDFGIRMTGMPDRWFVAPAGIVDDLYLPGFTAEDGNPDIGDSTVTKTAGFGGFAMATAPAIAHKEPGIGMVGAGVLRAQGKCFAEAFEVMREW